MPNHRIDRTNDDIQQALSSLLRVIKDPRVQQGLISVTRVDTTGDLKYSKIYLSVLGLQNAKEFKRGIKSAAPWLRRELGSRLSLRNTPELIFELDDSIQHGAHISAILAGLDIPPDDGEENEDDRSYDDES